MTSLRQVLVRQYVVCKAGVGYELVGRLCVCLHTAYNYLAASLHGLNHSSLTHTHTHCSVNEHVNRLAQIQCSNERLVVSIRN